MRSVELCAGCGGLALGAELAGFEPALVVELDGTCCRTLRRNRPHWNVVQGDILRLPYTELVEGQVDVLTGGIPCQAYSMAGKRLGMADARGQVFFGFLRAVKELNPRVLVIENVKGLVSHDKGATLRKIIQDLEAAGYRVQYKVLNAVDFGVAQKRERLFIVGVRNDVGIAMDQYTFPLPRQVPMKVLQDVLERIETEDVAEGVHYPASKRRILALVPPGGCWVDLPEDVQKQYLGGSYDSGGGKRGFARRLAMGEPCLTLTTSPMQKQTERCHPEEIRPFTVREYARIQSFPDSWMFEGSISAKYKQIGNAVPVDLAKAVLASVHSFLARLP